MKATLIKAGVTTSVATAATTLLSIMPAQAMSFGRASQVVGGGQLFYKRRGMVLTIPAELKQYVDYRSFRLSLPS